MSEQAIAYEVEISTQPRDLHNFNRRVLKLPPGDHLVVIHKPETQSGPITWTFLGSGKEENAR